MKVVALNTESDTNEFFIPGVDRYKVLQDLTEQKNKLNEGLNMYEDFVNKYFPYKDPKRIDPAMSANAFFQASDKLVEFDKMRLPLLSPSLALNALTTEKGMAENALMKALDSAITNEVDGV